MIKRAIQWLTISVLVMVHVFAFVTLYLFLLPTNILDIETPLPVLTKEVKVGEPISIHFQYCIRHDTAGIFTCPRKPKI